MNSRTTAVNAGLNNSHKTRLTGGLRFIPKRYTVTVLAFIGSMALGLLRTNLSIAIVEMTSNKTLMVGNKTKFIEAEFEWTPLEKGFILSAASVGSGFTFLGGILVNLIGGVTTFGVGTALMATLTIFSPLFLYMHIYMFILGKTLQGMLEGVAIVGIVDTFTHWAPPAERARLISYYFVGYYVGVAINYPVSGFIAYHFGWRAVFYATGIAVLGWCTVWLFFVRNDPADDKFISLEEKTFLKSEIENITHEKVDIPWRDILSSRAVYAYFNECFSITWFISFILYCLPLYVKDMYDVNVQDVGFITGLPILCSVIVQPIAAFFADHLRTHVFSVAKVHKIFIFWGNVCVLVLLLVTGLWSSFLVSVICFCLMRVAFSFADASYAVICIDMAGQYSGVIKGIGLSCAAVSSLLNPIMMGYLVPNHLASEWNLYFLILSFISIYGTTVFLIFGSGELQPWAIPHKRHNVEKDG